MDATSKFQVVKLSRVGCWKIVSPMCRQDFSASASQSEIGSTESEYTVKNSASQRLAVSRENEHVKDRRIRILTECHHRTSSLIR